MLHDTLIIDHLTKSYAVRHPIRAGTIRQLKLTISKYAKFLGERPRLSHLNSEKVNEWLIWLESHHGDCSRTLYNNRVNIKMLWNDAHSVGILPPPIGIRRVHKPSPQPIAWTATEFLRLLDAADQLKGNFKRNGVSRALYFRALFQAAYDTGLRKSDLFALKRTDISETGRIRLRQSKTRHAHVCELSHSTHSLVMSLPGPCPLWNPLDDKMFYATFRKLRRIAGLMSGSMQQIRRTSATAVYAVDPLKATPFLGHKTPTMINHYVDRSLVDSCVIRPPAHYARKNEL